ANSHVCRAVDVTIDNWRFHTTRTVRLNPSVLCEGVACQLLTEVFHHVVTLELSVYQHIDVQLFLKTDNVFGFFSDSLVVLFLSDYPFFKVGAPFTYIFSLRERTDSGGREFRKAEFLLLKSFTYGKW